MKLQVGGVQYSISIPANLTRPEIICSNGTENRKMYVFFLSEGENEEEAEKLKAECNFSPVCSNYKRKKAS